MVGIICTIGPASFRKVRELKKAGMDIARLNFAYAKPEQLDLLKGIPIMADVRKVNDLKRIPKKYRYAAISFISGAKQLHEARKLTKAKIVSKIETRQGMTNLRGIVEASDIVMVARGDLADAVGLENIFASQKKIIAECRRQKKPFIVATGILETMREKRKPSRAEVCDAAYAVSEGAGWLMLADETAVGKHPVEATAWLKRIIGKVA
jgi:pyruvate kinase